MAERLYITDLEKVIEKLEAPKFSKAKWRTLGSKLGLHKNTLDTIDENKRGNVEACFTECLSKWLQRADGVDDIGKPSFQTLMKALYKMDAKDEADFIRDSIQGKEPATVTAGVVKNPRKKFKENDKEDQEIASRQENGDDNEPMTKDGATVDGNEKSDAPQGPPDWEYDDAIVNYSPKKEEFNEDLVKGIEILLLPATDTEEKEVMYYLKKSDEKPVRTKIDRVKIHVGYYGKSKVIVIKTAPATNMQGSVYAAIITTKILERVKSIKYVVAIGVCFGKGSPEKQKLGDVVISTMICDCLSIRQGARNESRRGGDYSVKQDILSEFECPHNFEMPHNIKVLKVPIVTTPNLINNSKIKDELFKKSPIAKAGEMEGAGIMAAIEYAPERAEVIVIKGIGDWGDETKEDTKEWKPFAAHAAAHYVHAILSLDK